MNNDQSPVVWRKSSRSQNNGNCVEIAACLNNASWRKSSHSSTDYQCVEAAVHASAIAIRDSKHCEGHDYPTLSVAPADWTGFVATFAPQPTR